MKLMMLKLFTIMLLVFLQGCGDSNPLKIGFIGGTSGRVADLGVAGRNGVILAVEERNAAGGIKGQKIELILKDDKQETELSKKAAEELVAAGVAAILGPMTSSMAMEVVPVSNQSEILTMGTTVTTNKLTGKDDYFFRTLSPTLDHASETAKYLYEYKKTKKVAAVYDLNNKAYTESWLKDFSDSLEKMGGTITKSIPFNSSNQVKFEDIARDLIAATPDAIVLIVNSVDAALLAKQIRVINPDIQLAASAWAGTERLIELGGRYVERMAVPQFFDRYNQDAEYLTFYSAYLERFGHPPGFPGLVSYNATNVVLNALSDKKSGENLKQTILRIRQFPSIQGTIIIDEFGDSKSQTYLTEVIDGQFRLSE